jgi:hypothetical protein
MPNTDRLVPSRFEEYVDRFFEPLPKSSRCTGCFVGPAIARDTANSYCEPCLRYGWGFDQAEEKMVRALLGAAVAAALECGASKELVRRAVNAAVDIEFCHPELHATA